MSYNPVTCQTCQRETTGVTIGTSEYCALCGSRITPGETPAAIKPAAPAPLKSMDIRRGNTTPVVSARGTTARKLHHRVPTASPHALDLRAVKPTAPRGTVRVPTEIEPVAPPPRQPEAVAPEPEPVHKHRHHEHQSAQVAERLERAKSVPLSHHVSRFGKRLQTEPSVPLPPAPAVAVLPPLPPMPIPAAAVTNHESLVTLAATPAIAVPAKAEIKWTQYAAVGAAVAVMAGYIWLQNYPKLTIQAAAARAGVAATSPSYVPTSYGLASTATHPGLLTLSFKSPSVSSPLTIGQASTNWDSKSLLDHFVATTGSDYSTVNGQGLTIYLSPQNEAAWVNHGVWYSIKGTASLSRDQVLKIAYGL